MKKSIRDYKIAKIFELGFFLLMEIIFLVILISNKTMRSSIFVDKSLFILCAIMYFTVLVTLAYLLFDFFKLKKLKIEDHNLEQLAFLDRKTGIPNRTSVNLLFENYSTVDSMKGIGCVVSEIANIKEINSVSGKSIGDKAIRDFSGLYEKSADGFGFVGRNGGNEFITVIERCNNDKMASFINKLEAQIGEYNKSHDECNIVVHSEYVLFDSEEVGTFSELIARAYKKLGR